MLTVGTFPRNPDGSWDDNNVTAEQKIQLDHLHFKKIDLADEILVINNGDYLGESTRNEINYARMKGKPVRFAFPHDKKCIRCRYCAMDPDELYCAHPESLKKASPFGMGLNRALREICQNYKNFELCTCNRPNCPRHKQIC